MSISCNNKYELCQACRQTFVPVTYPLVFGKRLCTCCAINERARLRKENSILQNYAQIRAASEAV
jgi:hypothetical protein